MTINAYQSLCKVPLTLYQILMKLEFSQQALKYTQYKI